MQPKNQRSEVITGFDGGAWQPPAVDGRLVVEAADRRLINPPTARDLESLQAAARQEGLKQGYDEGFKKGMREGTERLADACRRFEAVMQRLAQPLHDMDDAVVNSIAELSLLIARQLVRRELKLDPGEVVAVVRQALSCLPIAARYPRIRLHPDDLDIVADALGVRESERSWELQPDPSVSRGGCLIETESSYIDATIEARIAAIASKMLGGERESDRAH